jgi:hypothetical protein
MITASDFIRLPYSHDLTQCGIAYACRSLHFTYDRMGGSEFARLRRIVGGVAVELALRRHLGEQDIPFDVKGATPFTDPDRYDVSLGGHRCDVKSFLITKRGQISAIRRNPSTVLRAPALIPSDQFAAETHADGDIYLFAFLTGLIALTQEDQQRAREAGQPLYQMCPMPREWSRPPVWTPLDRLTMKSECEEQVTIEVGGQNAERGFTALALELPPRTLVRLPQDFFSLSYVHAGTVPSARIGIHSPVRGDPHLIGPDDWGNIWVYGMEVILAGYLTREEFRRRAEHIPEGTRVFQYTQTRTKNLAVPVANLRPLGDLFEKVRQWEAAHGDEADEAQPEPSDRSAGLS